MKIWIDIENPPQVQFLLPFRRAFESAHIETVITARNYGSTLEMLRREGIDAHAFGSRAGSGRLRKAAAAGLRARDLQHFFSRTGRPDAALSASRAAPLAASVMRIPSFVICDYEYTDISVCKLTRSTLLFPSVIEKDHFRRRGLRARQLVPFEGLKEDLTFADMELDAFAPYDLGPVPDGALRVLFRPPAETSHYHTPASTAFSRATLAHLATEDVLVVFSPRDSSQVSMLGDLRWRHEPHVLERPVPFVSLLKSIDVVVCAGGTLLREAAYLGIPAYSIFQSEIGAVDRWLETIGRARLLAGPGELDRIELRQRGALRRLNSNPDLLDEIAHLIIARAGARPRRKQHEIALARS